MKRITFSKDELGMVLSGLDRLHRYIEFELESNWFTDYYEEYLTEYEPVLEKIELLTIKLKEKYNKW